MSFQRRTATTTEAQIRKCADLGMSMRQAAEQLGVSFSMLTHTASVLGIRFCGYSGCRPNSITLKRHAAHDPFGQSFPVSASHRD